MIGVLLIESNPTDAGMFGEWLSSAKSPAFDIQRLPSFEPGLALARHADAILLGMPMIAVESLPRMSRTCDAAAAAPLIVLLGYAKEVAMPEALRLGGWGPHLTGCLVHQHGGRMKGESSPGVGTRITAAFPRRAHRAGQRTGSG